MRSIATLVALSAAVVFAGLPATARAETNPAAGIHLDPFAGWRTGAPSVTPVPDEPGRLPADDGGTTALIPVDDLPFEPGFDAPDVVITQSSSGLAAISTDYQPDGSLWAAASFRQDSACRVFRSTDGGFNWDYFGGFNFPNRALVRRLKLVVGNGDSARVHLFALHPTGQGDLYCVRWNMDGTGLTGYNVLVGPDTITEFAACRDHAETAYRLYAVAHNGMNSTAFPRSLICRSTNFGRAWAVVDTMANCDVPHMSAGAGSYVYIAAVPYQSIWYGYVGAVISDNYGEPGSWVSRAVRPDTQLVLMASIAPAFTLPAAEAMVWLSYTDHVGSTNRYRVLALHSSNAGGNWQGPVLIGHDPSKDALAGYLRNLSNSGDESMHISYWQFFDVYARHATASAPTVWSSPVQMNDTHRSNYDFGCTPQLILSCPRQEAGAVWMSQDSTKLLWGAPWMTGLAERPGPAPAGAGFAVAPSPALNRLRFDWEGPAADVALFDVTGRELRRFRAQSPGFAWNRRDEAGRRVPAGTYLARLETPAGSATRAVVLR